MRRPDRLTRRPMEVGSDNEEAFDPIKQARLMTHLQDKLPAFEFTSVPVGQYVVFLSEFSTVPMVIDAESLVEGGKSAKTRISVKLDDATVEDALKAALDKPGLAFHIEPGRLVITARAAKSRNERPTLVAAWPTRSVLKNWDRPRCRSRVR